MENAGALRAVMTAPSTWLLSGLEGSLARLADAAAADGAQGPDSQRTFAPLFEALNWVAALLDATGPSIASPEANGTRYVRNRVHHDLAAAMEPRTEPVVALSGPLKLEGESFVGWFWRAEANLPQPSPGYEDPRGLADYRNFLEGRRVDAVLTALATELKSRLPKPA